MIIIVAGFGRCGSSLMMQCLHAMGIPCLGEAPAFEDPRTLFTSFDPSVFQADGTLAVKVLDPQRDGVKFPSGPEYRCIWMTRDREQQARSMMKFMRIMLGRQPAPPGRHELRKIMDSYERDEPVAIEKLSTLDDVTAVSFEQLIVFPKSTVHRVVRWLDLDLDAKLGASVVVDRPITAMSDLSIESFLVDQAERRAV